MRRFLYGREECKVYGIPDSIRGMLIRADIALKEKTIGTIKLKEDIQAFVKHNTAPYKYPRVIEFVNEIEKTTSGKKVRRKSQE